jgi:hypothetical protein
MYFVVSNIKQNMKRGKQMRKATERQINMIVGIGYLDIAEAEQLSFAEASAIISSFLAEKAQKRLIRAGILTKEKAGTMTEDELIKMHREFWRVIEANEINTVLKQFSVGETVNHYGQLVTIVAIRLAELYKHHQYNITLQRPGGKKYVVNCTSIKKIVATEPITASPPGTC